MVGWTYHPEKDQEGEKLLRRSEREGKRANVLQFAVSNGSGERYQTTKMETVNPVSSSFLTSSVPSKQIWSHCFSRGLQRLLLLGFLQQYLVEERQLRFLGQLTENELRGWVTFLRRPSSSISETTRKASTITTYGRSVRAFCHWVVSKGSLPQTPLVQGILPKTESKRIQVLEPVCFDRLLVACRPEGAQGVSGDRVAARNRAILWILLKFLASSKSHLAHFDDF